MIAMCRKLGFQVAPDPEDATLRIVTLKLAGEKPDPRVLRQ
jgi:hypothetical protein